MSRIVHGTLVAAVPTVVSIDSGAASVTVINRSLSGEIYFTVDGSTPTVLGANCNVCLGARVVQVPSVMQATTVSLISVAGLNYSVESDSQ